MPSFIDLTGKTFDRWTVISREANNKYNHPTWLCRCQCGNTKIVDGKALRSGDSKSCGCYNLEVRTRICIERNSRHGASKRGNRTKEYIAWINIRARCHNKNATSYHKYGAKGIQVCREWQNSFDQFLKDIGYAPTSKHTIDRINNLKNYEPGNVRWSTQKVQQNNRGNNRMLTYKGEHNTLQYWCDKFNLHRKTVTSRLARNDWSVERALETPAKKP